VVSLGPFYRAIREELQLLEVYTDEDGMALHGIDPSIQPTASA
jgi:hypothetical protein